MRPADSPKVRELRNLFRGQSLHTVCEEALCPNLAECWARGTATFLLMGDTCTRSCGFCKIKTGRGIELDPDEPRRVAESVQAMGLNHTVLTSVNRTNSRRRRLGIRRKHPLDPQAGPGCTVEVLIPDFQGSREALAKVLAAQPEILNHNIETVPRLYRTVRPQARYRQSLELLRQGQRAGKGAR